MCKVPSLTALKMGFLFFFFGSWPLISESRVLAKWLGILLCCNSLVELNLKKLLLLWLLFYFLFLLHLTFLLVPSMSNFGSLGGVASWVQVLERGRGDHIYLILLVVFLSDCNTITEPVTPLICQGFFEYLVIFYSILTAPMIWAVCWSNFLWTWNSSIDHDPPILVWLPLRSLIK